MKLKLILTMVIAFTCNNLYADNAAPTNASQPTAAVVAQPTMTSDNQKNFQALQAQIKQIQTNNQEQLAQLQTTMQAEISVLQAQLPALDTKLQKQIADLQTLLQGQIQQLQQSINQQTQDLEGQINDIKK